MSVVERGEVELYGVRYRILGPVQRVPVAPFPQKITIGDYTRDDEIVASSWVQTSWTGGLGIQTGTYPRDQDRFWYSTLDTRWPRTLGLGPFIYQAELDVGTEGVGRTARLGSVTVISVGRRLYRLFGSGLTLLLKEYPGPITDLVVSGGKLWICGPGFDLESWDGVRFQVEPRRRGVHLADLGGWLYLMDETGHLQVRRGGEEHWDPAGTFTGPPGWVSQLLVYTRPDGEWSLYAVAADGLYIYDPTTLRFFPTQMTWTVGLPVGRACSWRGDLYVPVGSSVYRWNGQTLTSMGPDRDEGIPVELADQVAAVYPAHGFLVAVLTNRTEVQRDIGRGEARATRGLRPGTNLLGRGVFGVESRVPTEASIPPDLRRDTVILATSGDAWHVLAAEPGALATPVGVPEMERNLLVLWHRAGHLRWVRLPMTLYNPLRPVMMETQAEGELITPWFDAGWAEIDKVALRLKVRTEQAMETCRIEVLYQVDQQLDWTTLGQVTTTGETELPFTSVGGELGQVFRRLRLRFRLARTDGSRFQTPVLSSFALSFLRRLPTRYGFQFTIDLSQAHRGKSPTELRDALLSAVESQLTGTFRYADDPGGPRRVVISRLQFAQDGGLSGFAGPPGARGRAAVSVIEV